MKTIKKLLVANRSEIAVRVFQTCKSLGIRTVAVYSDADEHAVHRFAADESICLGGKTPAESYLQMDRILDAIDQTGADAVHPGYGFLSENAEFAKKLEDKGVCFLGPSAEHIVAMGDKVQARQLMQAAGVPVIPGTDEPVESLEAAESAAKDIGFPLLVKAAGGGGGKGIRRVNEASELANAWERATSEAASAFGDPRVYLERLVSPARHIEAQILGDGKGGALFIGERECSLQRNHQKLVEETPSPVLPESVRAEFRKAALSGVSTLKYSGAGTMEFLYDDNTQEFFFLEMNTRLQVEHPVSEMVTGLDLVAEQIQIAQGATLKDREDPIRRGHSIEFRLYAEDPYRQFTPSTGQISGLRLPHAPFCRIDAALREGMEVSPFYDPMLGKIIVWGQDREQAIARMDALLSRTRIGGIHTTLPLGIEICRWPAFQKGDFNTGSLEEYLDRSYSPKEAPEQAVLLAALIARSQASNRIGQGKALQPSQGQTHSRVKWQDRARWEGTKRH